MGAASQETHASCHRALLVPRAGKYKVWVRYVDHRHKTEPFTVSLAQGEKTVLSGELGTRSVVPPNDEYQLYWGFSFGWGAIEGNLEAGPALLTLAITRACEAWRQVDAVLLTDDLAYVPTGREKPPSAYGAAMNLHPKDGATWRGSLAAGDVDLSGAWVTTLQEYLRRGGTLVVNIDAAKPLPPEWLGVRRTGKTVTAEEWRPADGAVRQATPFDVAGVELDGATVLAWASPKVPLITRKQVGAGAVIATLVPGMLGQDERAHPALPYLMNGLTAGLLPVQVLLPDGSRPGGEVMYQVNRTKDGYLVALFNNHGVDKTPLGVARVDRRAFVDVVIRTALPVRAAKEWTQPRDLTRVKRTEGTEVPVRVHPDDVQVIGLEMK